MIKVVKKQKKENQKISTLNIRVECEFDKKWKQFAKDNKINTSQTIRIYLEEIMNNFK